MGATARDEKTLTLMMLVLMCLCSCAFTQAIARE